MFKRFFSTYTLSTVNCFGNCFLMINLYYRQMNAIPRKYDLI